MSIDARAALDVDVIVVAHNAGALLAGAVRTAAEQAGEDRVWVVDAESTDGSVAPVRAAYPETHVLEVPNAGFSASNNRAIERTEGAYVMLLNPDAELAPGALERLVATARDNPRAGIVGALVVNPDGSVQAEGRGHYPSLRRAAGYRLWREWQRIRGNRAMSPRVPRRVTSAQWVTGAGMLVRRRAIDEVGPLDERFFLYLEDVDWCRRMRDSGWRVLVDPEARVVHHLQQSGVQSGVLSNAYVESLMKYCDKYRLRVFKRVMERRFASKEAL